MSTEKLTNGYLAAVNGAAGDDAVSALFRTRSAEPDSKLGEQQKLQELVRPALHGERLATRRADLLRLVTERYGEGELFRGAVQEAAAEAHARIIDAAPLATGLWLADAIAVSGTRKEIEDLARHQDVVSVEANPVFELPRTLQTPLEDVPETVDGSAWGVAKVGAPKVWSGLGRGAGVLVGHLDTGVDDSHPALAGKVTAFQEFDAMGMPVASTAHDSGTHGTHTAGTIVGRTFKGVNIGVAPAARLASALVLPGGSGSFAQIIAGMQWTIDQGVHVINMSLGAIGYQQLWNLPALRTALAGVVLVASIGNSGHGTSGGPGNDPVSIGVGATNHLDEVAGFSSGQTLVNVPYFAEGLTYMKPDISAPGVQVVSSVPGAALAAFNGTSMAAPHVAGAVALLQSTDPALRGDPLATRKVLLGTVEDFGEAGSDQRFGFGRIDARSAAEQTVAML
jgi:subtilisin family serine protease